MNTDVKRIRTRNGNEYGIEDEESRKRTGELTELVKEHCALESIIWKDDNLDNYVSEGTFFLKGNRVNGDNVPILNEGVIAARLSVLSTQDDDNTVITQVLNLNNLGGGEGNIYIRSYQNDTWKPWGKLQTNVEVGQITPNDMSNLIDNGIYSGVCVDGTTVETFVLIVINNYLAATQVGFGGYISQLKYAIDLNRGNTVKTRTRDAYGTWSDWSEIGGSTYELPKATQDTLGGVKLGNANFTNYAPLVALGTEGGVGIGIDVNYFMKLGSSKFLSIKHNNSLTVNDGLSVRLGTETIFPIIPCVIGSKVTNSEWDTASVGVPYNTEQFCLKKNGLNLVDGIIKVTWDANSTINDYITAGVYDITGTRGSIYDYLPITNLGENATISARLIVTVTPEGATTYRHSIGQTLILSNAEGKETKVYIRNGNRTSTNGGVSYTISWSNWRCLQGMVEYGVVTDKYSWGITDSPTGNAPGLGMHDFTENGMYSGIYTDDYTLQSPTFVETFVLVVINDYAVSSQAGTPRRISQLKYATDTLTGQCTVKKRVGTGSDSISWSDWADTDSRELVEKKDVISTIDDSESPVQSKAIAEALAEAVEQGRQLAKRDLYATVGAVYNDTDSVITRTITFPAYDENTTQTLEVAHLPGCYYLNGLGNITEEQMGVIYNEPHNLALPNAYSGSPARTLIFRGTTSVLSIPLDGCFLGCSNLEIINYKIFYPSSLTRIFYNSSKLKYVLPVSDRNAWYAYQGVPENIVNDDNILEEIRFHKLRKNAILSKMSKISKNSIRYMINTSDATSAITITLHPNVYAVLSEDADVIADLETKNSELASTGGSISLVSA